MDSRLTMANMAIEAGGKAGIIAPDKVTKEYVQGRAKRPYKFFHSDSEAKYGQVLDIDVTRIEPQVAFPHLPSNVKPISAVGGMSPSTKSVIGSCTNGRLEDLRICRPGAQREETRPLCAADHHPGDPGNLPSGHEGRPF